MVRDHDGQQLAYVYFENEPGRVAASCCQLARLYGSDRWHQLLWGRFQEEPLEVSRSALPLA